MGVGMQGATHAQLPGVQGSALGPYAILPERNEFVTVNQATVEVCAERALSPFSNGS